MRKGPLIKIKVRSDGSLKVEVISAKNKKIADIRCEKGKFNKIERMVDNANKSRKVIHSAWDNNFYHEDIKYEKSSNPNINKKLMKRKN